MPTHPSLEKRLKALPQPGLGPHSLRLGEIIYTSYGPPGSPTWVAVVDRSGMDLGEEVVDVGHGCSKGRGLVSCWPSLQAARVLANLSSALRGWTGPPRVRVRLRLPSDPGIAGGPVGPKAPAGLAVAGAG